MPELAIVFATVYALNVVPAFAPPTWMALSIIGFEHPTVDVGELALVGALAATAGRLTLARLARAIVRQRFFDERHRRNVDAVKEALEGRRTLTAGAFLLYAFTPFPSNVLFIAYGLTSLPMRSVAVPFCIGRFLSYSFWVYSASTAARHLVRQPEDAESYLGVWFVVSQCVFLLLLYVFAKIDWRRLLHDRSLHWLGGNDERDAP